MAHRDKLDARKISETTKKAVNKFYVYMYLDLDNIPFYIGKGKDYRYYVSEHLQKCRSNPFLKNKIRKIGVDNIKIHFFHENITEEEAFFWEKYWIKCIGRRDLKEGTLCNLTDGGEGTSGYTHSDKTKEKMSKVLNGLLIGKNHPMYGKSLSNATKQKISVNLKGRTLSTKTKQKISKTMEGRKLSDEHKRAISVAKKKAICIKEIPNETK